MMDAEELRAVSRRSVEWWNARNFDEFYSEFHPDVVYHASEGTEVHGVEALRARYDAVLAWCPDLTITVTLCVADSDAGLLASMQVEKGTATNGEPFSFEGMTFFRMGSDGRVAECWENARPLQ